MENQRQAVFFDFDGVILDSVDVKTRAFSLMFQRYGPEIEKAVVEYHLAHGGVSRFEKFKYAYTELLGRPIDQAELDALGREFVELALQGVLDAPFIPGALRALECLKGRATPAFVVSGTPDEEIKSVVGKRGLASYFVEVHGSPRKKVDILRDLAGRFDLSLPDCLFIGDAMTDFHAAQACGVPFLGIVKEGEASPFPPGTRISGEVHISGGSNDQGC